MQIYIDGVLRFVTPDDRMAGNLHLDTGTHRITAKAWDDWGAFSTTTIVTSCSNTVNRTVKICTPQNRESFQSRLGGPAEFEFVAVAATDLKFSGIQLYIDGFLFNTLSSKLLTVTAQVHIGEHRITVKGWDSIGAFSSSVTVDVR